MIPRLPRLLVYGNCQGGWLSRALARQPEVAAQYEIVYLSDYGGGPPADHPVHEPGFFGTLSVAIWQTAAVSEPPPFLGALPVGCRQIRYPTLWLKLLWPTYVVDSRNRPETEFPWGRYPYGDRVILRLIEEGVPQADLVKRYLDTDLNTLVNLDRFSEMSLAELRFNDRQSDLAITPFIEANLRQRKLFGTVNHPTYVILRFLYKEVLQALLGRAVAAKTAPATSEALLGTVETPLHPQIISHFKLAWARPGMKWLYHSRFLTLEEYLEAYGSFAHIPAGSSPQLWLARAQQAVHHGNYEEAELLLLEAASCYPQVVQFLHYLGSLRARQGRLVEAEQAFRFALGRHAPSASLVCDLGLVMLRRGVPGEAARLFQEALRLDPHHVEARKHLEVAARAVGQEKRPEEP